MMGTVRLSSREIAVGYDQAAKGYDARHHRPGQRKYDRIEASMRRMLHRGQVLDLGCGTGRLLRGVSPSRGVGIDISLEMLRRAPTSINTACADSHQLPFADASFDAVIAAQGVVRYLDLPRAMSEVARVLRPGGRFAAHQFGDVFSFRRLRLSESSLSLRSADDLTGPANSAGLTTVDIELWRPIRVFPYALRVPKGLPRGVWTHCVAIFEKPQEQVR